MHMAVLESLGCVVVDCGGDGDCFYHCMLWLAQTFCPGTLHGSSCTSHLNLRVAVVDHVEANWDQINLSRDVPIIATLEARSKSKGTNKKKVQGFCKVWKQQGVYVENEVVAAFAHFSGHPVVVHNIFEEHIHVLLPAALQQQCDIPPQLMNHTLHENEEISSTPFVLWCNGGHYQAVVPKRLIHIAKEAMETELFKNENVVYSKDVTRRS